MKILVISDLHIGDEARGKDLCPGKSDNAIEAEYKNDFINFIKSNGIEVEYIFITGDISNRATINEFELAKKVIEEIATAIDVRLENVLIVPGNHDVDWSVFKSTTQNESDQNFEKSQRYNTIKYIFGDEIKQQTESPFFSIWNHSELFVIGFNSAWNDWKHEEVHHGLISTEIIDKMDAEINKLDLSSKYKVFITHHHIYNYSDPIDSMRDYSMMVNSEKLINMLSKNNFDLVVHGHKHIPRIKPLYDDCGHFMSALCAGSFSALLDHKYNGLVFNMFHVIDIEGRDANSNDIYGYINNYHFLTGHKWKEFNGNEYTNIIFQHGFGEYTLFPNLKNNLKPIIQDQILKDKCAKWTTLCENNPRLSYNPPDLIEKLTKEISKELDIERYKSGSEILFLPKHS